MPKYSGPARVGAPRTPARSAREEEPRLYLPPRSVCPDSVDAPGIDDHRRQQTRVSANTTRIRTYMDYCSQGNSHGGGGGGGHGLQGQADCLDLIQRLCRRDLGGASQSKRSSRNIVLICYCRRPRQRIPSPSPAGRAPLSWPMRAPLPPTLGWGIHSQSVGAGPGESTPLVAVTARAGLTLKSAQEQRIAALRKVGA